MATYTSTAQVNVTGNVSDLDAKLAKQEAAIKTLDGAINLIGGSVELAASAMVGLGLTSKENAEQFEATALAAIAFADGSKRVIDGVKSLNEGLKAFGGIAGLAAKAQKAMNAAILANPYVAVAAALAVLTAAVYAYVVATDDAAEAAENLARRQAAAAAANTTYADTEVRLAQARGEAQSVVLQLQLDAIKAREAEIAQLLDSNIETAEANKLLEEGRKLYQDTKVVKEQLKKATNDEAEATRKAAEDEKERANAKKKQDDAELARLAELKKARQEAAVAGLSDLAKQSIDLDIQIQKQRIEQLQTFAEDYKNGMFFMDEETIQLQIEDFKELEERIRKVRLTELQNTISAQFEANQKAYDEVKNNDEATAAQKEAALKTYEANYLSILDFYQKEQQRIREETSTEDIAIQLKFGKEFNDIVAAQAQEIQDDEEKSLVERRDDLLQFYNDSIAAAEANGLSVVELEKQKAAVIKEIDKQIADDRKAQFDAIVSAGQQAVDAFGSIFEKINQIYQNSLQLQLLALGDNEKEKEKLLREAFETYKKYQTAEALINGISGALSAFASVQNLNNITPGLGVGVGLALAALVAGITAQQVSLIQQQTFEGSGGSVGSISAGGRVNLPGISNLNPQFAQGGFLAPGATTPSIIAPEQPIQAYVLASDVTLGLQAYGQIGRRRRFG